ncbi:MULTISPECIES: AraC family transcriptional regulator [unclassified Variovorax]|jgi:AraC-like DNA-binding protein|uniref:AraC family transcriptional regulator n=1 Tax=unclassified Variovorax TaxID=663243 RepID=UPI00089B9EFC|nr:MULTISPECIES: helix-turn-helix transcriptional regulator [unclassified Variovorax]SDW74410.1 AraC-type DNA-binding protein [Variovorax sp. YR634]SDZ55131.1 AraC-type DNA-binding protein [Variovorax sp. YR266]
MPSAASPTSRSAAPARPRGALPAPITSVASLTPHLYAPDAVRPLRAKEHFLSADTLVELHEHPWPQLTFSTRGVIRLSTQDGSYIVPPSRALWVPANMPHSITLIEDAELRTVYLHAWIAPTWEKCEVLEISPLLRALMLALDTTPDGLPPTDPHAPQRERMIAPLLVDEVERATQIRIDVPLPTDKRLRQLCEALLRNPADRATLAERAATIGASERTVARLFRDQLGMSWQQWRQQAVMAHALPLLARGMAVSQVAAASGYATDSAFCAMFKAATGRSPTSFQHRKRPTTP